MAKKNKKVETKHPDLTRTNSKSGKLSVGKAIEAFIPNINQYKNLNELKNAFKEIINSDNVSVSKLKINEYNNELSKIHNLFSMQLYITNIYCKSANLGLS